MVVCVRPRVIGARDWGVCGKTGCYRVVCALSVSARVNVSNITFVLNVHLSFN